MMFDIDSLSIEITRRCNMNCAHCLRGDPEDVDMSYITLYNTIANFNSIRYLTFTGGEPTLNVPAMYDALEVCKMFHTPVYGFYIVTNGKVVFDDFLRVCDDWYAYCYASNTGVDLSDNVMPAKEGILDSEMELSGVALSGDQYHEPIPFRNYLKLSSRTYFRTDKLFGKGLKTVQVASLGRGCRIPGASKRNLTADLDFDEEEPGKLVLIDSAHINVYGEIFADADTPYCLSHSEFSLGNVSDKGVLEKLYADYQAENL